jgi:hypothetical protein
MWTCRTGYAISDEATDPVRHLPDLNRIGARRHPETGCGQQSFPFVVLRHSPLNLNAVAYFLDRSLHNRFPQNAVPALLNVEHLGVRVSVTVPRTLTRS